MPRPFSVGAEEIFAMEAFGGSGRMDDNLPSAEIGFVCGHLRTQDFRMREVQFCKFCFWVGQVLLTAGIPHAGPDLMSALQAFFYDKTANEAAGSSH